MIKLSHLWVSEQHVKLHLSTKNPNNPSLKSRASSFIGNGWHISDL